MLQRKAFDIGSRFPAQLPLSASNSHTNWGLAIFKQLSETQEASTSSYQQAVLPKKRLGTTASMGQRN